ncbi:stage II sporulation protein M [Candidatus Woesearchaeota archaeon]|nr:stage II sporulation protein M [Candidatus Woesearchaeota archaeon]
MVLESMINPKNAEDKPLHVLVISIIYTFIAVAFAYLLFPAETPLLSVALITIIFVPFFQKMFYSEEKDERIAAMTGKGSLFSRHIKPIYVFSAFFLGVVIAMSAIFVFSPIDLFSLQADTVRSLGSGGAVEDGDFYKFVTNNTQVLVLMFVLSVLFGAGAVFLLAWNASVIAVYSGIFVRSMVQQGLDTTAAYALGLPIGLGAIALHGIPEIAAYFVAGIAGGILSVGMVKEKIPGKRFNLVFKDSIKLLVLAEILILLAAWIEAF